MSDKKTNKNLYIGLLLLALLISISAIVAVQSNKSLKENSQNSYVVASFYIPDKDNMYLDAGPLSVLTNKLLYTPSLTNTKAGLNLGLAKSFDVDGNKVTVKYESTKESTQVYDSIYKLGREVYENNFLLYNISGFEDYTLGSETISGMMLAGDSIIFTVLNPEDLSFLTVPTVTFESTFKIKDYNNNSFTITDGNISYNFILVNKENINETNFDILLTNDTEFTVENTQNYLIDLYNDYIILNNFTDEEKEEFSGIFDGKRAKFDFTLYLLCDSSYKGALLTEKIKSYVNTQVSLDYGYREYFLKELDTDNKFAVFYEDSALDLNTLQSLKNIKLIKVPAKQINVIYKNNIL